MTNSKETQSKTRLKVEESEAGDEKQAEWKELEEKSAPDLVVTSQAEIALADDSTNANENVGAVPEPGAAVLAPLSKPGPAAQESTVPAGRGAPRLPQTRYGLLTGIAFLFALFWLPAETMLPGRSGGFNCLFVMIVSFVLHVFWLYKSRIALEKATRGYLPESGPRDNFWLSLIFYSLPFC